MHPYSIAETVMNKDLRFEPGTDYQYSNSNYLLLGLIAKEATGKELDKLLDEKLSNIGDRCKLSHFSWFSKLLLHPPFHSEYLKPNSKFNRFGRIRMFCSRLQLERLF
ncbi:MAG: serine hydrolase [Lewinellaceae bacterium]|nr:serine hydrolase [Saprospiraceae bacterium]MCB9340027.1 serine hydrolase [Lewinellaceae bacterium]